LIAAAYLIARVIIVAVAMVTEEPHVVVDGRRGGDEAFALVVEVEAHQGHGWRAQQGLGRIGARRPWGGR